MLQKCTVTTVRHYKLGRYNQNNTQKCRGLCTTILTGYKQNFECEGVKLAVEKSVSIKLPDVPVKISDL